MKSLFQASYELRVGKASDCKVDCDVLTTHDYFAITEMALEILPRYGSVEAAGPGGIRLASWLTQFSTPVSDALLIVDDIWDDGLALTRLRPLGKAHVGLVIFALREPPSWCRAIWKRG